MVVQFTVVNYLKIQGINTGNFEANKVGHFISIGSVRQWNVKAVADDDNNQTNLGPNELGQNDFQNFIIVSNSLMSSNDDLVPKILIAAKSSNPFKILSQN